MDDPTEKISISHDPDMYIVAGDGTKQLYVNSAILTAASTVFRAMFKPNFAEGASLRSSVKMHEQLLPDDDEEATLLVMAMLHYNMKFVPATLNQKSMFSLAKFAHKYDVVEAVSPIIGLRWAPMDGWYCWPIEDQLPTSEAHLVSELLASAYLLKLPSKFNTFSNVLILHTPGLRGYDLSEGALFYLPDELPGLLDDAQMDMRSKAALLAGERFKRIDDYPDEGCVRFDHQFFSYNGKRTTVGNQLSDLHERGLYLDGGIEKWFRQGLTHDVTLGTIDWKGALGEAL